MHLKGIFIVINVENYDKEQW